MVRNWALDIHDLAPYTPIFTWPLVTRFLDEYFLSNVAFFLLFLQFIHENGLEYHPDESRRVILQILPEICYGLFSSCWHGNDLLISRNQFFNYYETYIFSNKTMRKLALRPCWKLNKIIQIFFAEIENASEAPWSGHHCIDGVFSLSTTEKIVIRVDSAKTELVIGRK